MKKLLIILIGSSVTCQASFNSAYVVYGQDDRIEVFQAAPELQALAKSTAGMIETNKIIPMSGNMMLPPYTLQMDNGLCEEERFKHQATPLTCSGFLVGPDLLVTAGHCVTSQLRCDNISWVFDYKIDQKSGRAPVLLNSENVYKCRKLIDGRLENTKKNKYDYALIQLDRVVENRAPLKLRSSGKVKTDTSLTVIGHPSGLPSKVASGARVVKNDATNYFVANLDTFGGNSGSAVFDSNTGVVEGILVRGAKDYETSEGCAVVVRTTQEVKNFKLFGEAVSRITDVASLKYRWQILEAAKDGDILTLKRLGRLVPNISMIYDNNKNTALHIAAKNNKFKVVADLVAMGADLEARNLLGNTALHLAAQASTESVKTFLSLGSSALAVNLKGLRPIDLVSSSSYYSKVLLNAAYKKEINSNKEALVLARD